MSKLKIMREKACLTQVALADALGVSQACVAVWESGKSAPRSDKLVRLAEILDCTVDDLLRAPQASADGAIGKV